MRKGLLDLVGVIGLLMYDCASSGADGELEALCGMGVLCMATAPWARTWRAVMPLLRSRKT